ncbi:hypothetical protein TNCV_4824711 [Trichonephila clavipes]|nr:hypothetical protein TNCV_4824711 [Trichonephila clavipes]
MLEKVIENWTSRLDYIRASRGSPMPEIIFKITCDFAHKTFGPTDLTSTCSICTRKVFGGTDIESRRSGLESGTLTTRLPTAFPDRLPSGDGHELVASVVES